MSLTTPRNVHSAAIDWFGSLPADWGIDRLKYAFKRVQRPYVQQAETVTAFRDGIVTLRSNRRVDGFTEADKYIGYQGIEPGDLAIHAMDGFAGAIGVSDSSGKCSPVLSVCTPTNGSIAEYYAHVLRLVSRSGYLTAISKGVRERSTDFRWIDARDILVPYPPTGVQEDIVAFLDREIAKIDQLIGKQNALIEVLAERRKAVITQAVTRGLDPTVMTKASGVDWLGNIPSRWTVTPLKRLAIVQNGVTLGRTPAESCIEVPYLRVANVQSDHVDLSEVKTVAVPVVDLHRYLLQQGDVLMTEGGDIDKLGRGCVWDGAIDPCLHQNHIFAVRCSDRLNRKFLTYLLDSRPGRVYFELTAKRATNLASTNGTTLGRFSIGLPGTDEQESIVDHLDQQTARIALLTAKARSVVSVLRERRAALITAAVTGKIDVRAA